MYVHAISVPLSLWVYAVVVVVAVMEGGGVCSFDGPMERENKRYFWRELGSTTDCVFILIQCVYECTVCFLAEARNYKITQVFYRALCAIYVLVPISPVLGDFSFSSSKFERVLKPANITIKRWPGDFCPS